MSEQKVETCICSVCGHKSTLPEMVEHYRREHPSRSDRLYMDYGTIGDAFADKYISGLIDVIKEKQQFNSQDCARSTATINGLRAEVNKLTSALEYYAKVNVNNANSLNTIKNIIDSALYKESMLDVEYKNASKA